MGGGRAGADYGRRACSNQCNTCNNHAATDANAGNFTDANTDAATTQPQPTRCCRHSHRCRHSPSAMAPTQAPHPPLHQHQQYLQHLQHSVMMPAVPATAPVAPHPGSTQGTTRVITNALLPFSCSYRRAQGRCRWLLRRVSAAGLAGASLSATEEAVIDCALHRKFASEAPGAAAVPAPAPVHARTMFMGSTCCTHNFFHLLCLHLHSAYTHHLYLHINCTSTCCTSCWVPTALSTPARPPSAF
jgi:hypothetical protein